MANEMSLPQGPYRIEWIGDRDYIDVEDDNVDIGVIFATGEEYMATFFTLKNLRTLLDRYRATGECAHGLYFWASNMIVVERLADDIIDRTVQDLLDTGEFLSVFT